jgi:hypothetical protein
MHRCVVRQKIEPDRKLCIGSLIADKVRRLIILANFTYYGRRPIPGYEASELAVHVSPE